VSSPVFGYGGTMREAFVRWLFFYRQESRRRVIMAKLGDGTAGSVLSELVGDAEAKMHEFEKGDQDGEDGDGEDEGEEDEELPRGK
jgi:hypothetical protein